MPFLSPSRQVKFGINLNTILLISFFCSYYDCTTLSDYYDKMARSGTGCVPTHKSSIPSTSAVRSKDEVSSSSSSQSTWSNNPLIWTTIISLSIAVVATIVIVPLVICVHVRQRCKASGGSGEGQQGAPSSSAAYNAVENGTLPTKLSSTPIYVPQNGLKEKSGKSDLYSSNCVRNPFIGLDKRQLFVYTLQNYRTSPAIWDITQCYLPPDTSERAPP